MELTWLGDSSILLQTQGTTIYIDPVPPLEGWPRSMPAADLILLSHDHPTHFSHAALRQLRKDGTAVWGAKEVAAQLYGCLPLSEGSLLEFRHIRLHATPAYNPTPPRSGPPGIKLTHARGDAIGFLLELEDKRLYYAGDIGLMPELRQLSCDIALLPVGGTLTLRAKDAADAVERLGARTAIPLHWGGIEGTRDDAELFKEIVEDKKLATAIIPERNRPIHL